jgi:ACS family hexuronate transporter-like MFS transporter
MKTPRTGGFMKIDRAGTAVANPVITAAQERIGHLRWSVCALLFFAATVNYIDRQVIGILKPTLQDLYHWSEIDYSNIVFAFTAAYAIGLLVVGRVIDLLGVRKGFSFAVIVWSIAAMGHSLARSVLGFGAARFALGLGESGAFPSSIKAVAEWFPRKERALATGIFNSGTNIGAVIAPLAVPWITITYGWQWAFIATGALGFVWVIAWLASYGSPQKHPRISEAELAHIQSDAPESQTRTEWRQLLPHRQTYAFAAGKFLTDPIWWVYLYWVPDFLHKKHGLSLTEIGPPVVAIYILADIGSIGGGWLSSFLIKRHWSVNASRKLAMLVCAVSVVPIVFASVTTSLWTAVVLIGLAAAAHQGWSANLFTLASDMFPRRAVASVVGIGGMAGAIGGMLIAKVVGYLLEWTGSYLPVFIIAGSAYLIALAVIHYLAPRMDPATC